MNQFLAAMVFVAAGITGNVPENIKQLVDSGQYQQAYDYSQQWHDDYAGVPEYDLYYGIAALELGHYPQATMALDRVLMLQPNNPRAKLEWGRLMFLLRDYSVAEQAFSDVLQSNPPAPVQHRVQIFLDSIDARRKARSFATSLKVDLKAGFSSNINSATAARTTTDFIFFGEFPLAESSRETESAYLDSTFTFNATRPITERRIQYLTLEYRNIANEVTNDFNIDVINLGGGYMLNIGETQVRLPLTYQAIAIDTDWTQNFVSVGFDAITPMDNRNDWINFALLGAKRFKDEHLRDTDLAMLGTGWGYVFPGFRWKAVGSVFLGEDHARKQDTQGNTFAGIRGAVEHRLNLDHQLSFNLLYQESRYHDKGIFVELREDTLTEATLNWHWRLQKNCSVRASLNYTQSDSSLTLFTYDRFKSELGLIYVFD
ncbi:MAG: hypothetical protein MI976_09480 [Pseudomonadales bacterium]|nr:hypothetical protein [Pseudomonadales bacterium]